MRLDGIHLGIGAAILAATLYGFIPNLARLAIDQKIPALETVACRTIAPILLLGSWALISKQRLQVPREARGSFIIQCLATFTISTCYLASLQFIPVGLSVIIFFSAPIIILVLSPILEGRRLRLRDGVFAGAAFSGLVLALGQQFNQFDGVGIGLAALAALAYAAQFFSGRNLGKKISPQAMGSMVHLTILPPVIAVTWWFSDGGFVLLSDRASASAWLFVLAVGLFYCGAYVLQMSAVKAAPASIVAPWFNLEPVVTTGLALILLNEKLSLSHVTGGLIVLGVLLLSAAMENNQVKKTS